MSNRGIEIKTVQGGSSRDQNDLKNCYFVPTGYPGDYQFYNKNGNLVVTNPALLTSGTDFTFTLDGLGWSVTNFEISGTTTDGNASGNWVNNQMPESEEGSFQAQAGPGAEESVSATA